MTHTKIGGPVFHTMLVDPDGNPVTYTTPVSGGVNTHGPIQQLSLVGSDGSPVTLQTVGNGAPMATLTDGATIAWDASQGVVATVTLGGNRTIANPTNLKAGQDYTLIVKQDGTGSRTLAYGSKYKFAGGTAPTLTTTAGATDLLRFIYDGTNLLQVFIRQDVR